jgi:nucleoside phosphorylase
MKVRRAPRRPASPVTVGVLCPSAFEYEALKDLAPQAHAAILLSGMGKVRSAWGVHELRRKYPALKHILLAGFAGGLKGLKIGDLIEPRAIVEQDYCAEPFEKFPNRIRLAGPRLVKGSRDAVLLTQDRFLKENPYAADGSAMSHARLACDMEAYAVVWTARRIGLNCSVLKLISDEADADAGHDFLKACTRLRPRLQTVLVEAIAALKKSR